ncbi:MAG: DUF1926 domain-containing protein [Planctomycetales bacterium]|nr:DUF1926 domain-containing protein [Planctomycetales bacterium]
MSNQIRLCLVLHNHQPIGNFDDVIERAYQDSYLPFLKLFEEYAELRLSLHTSGPLLLWLMNNHPDYVQRVSSLVSAGRIEILGGPFYEPILTMLPNRDRVGQIRNFSDYLSQCFGASIRGMWMPERVWEGNLTSDIACAGIAYTVLDDFHFRAAGLTDEQLCGYFLTEDNGSLLRVFPGSEKLRYLLPFAPVHETIALARDIAQRHSDAILVFGDDGEKFGTWPDTKQHVYEDGWLRTFFDALVTNQDWLITSTLAQAVHATAPLGKIYLPDCSYREMTQWALPAEQQTRIDEINHEFHSNPRWSDLQSFLRGGNWRNFKVRYPEANEMYARMLEISRRLDHARRTCGDGQLLAEIEDHLYRGQCNCPYWHGAFGGIYLPHLRNAIYEELIAADNQLEYLEHGQAAWVDAVSEDFNLDLCPEVRLANDQLAIYVAPAQGGMMYELDVRSIQQNLLATINRRPEAYHRKILQGSVESEGVASIHDRVVFKQDDLDQKLQYDQFPRKSFLEHFYDNDLTLNSVSHGNAMERGDFVAQPFDAKLRRAASKVQLQLSRDGNAWGIPFNITKAITLEAGSKNLHIAYLLQGLPRDRQLHLALEWNFSGLPANVDDRYFYDATGRSLGHLGTALDLDQQTSIGMLDSWQGLDILIQLDRPTNIWTFPIETVSQSESGYELVYQSLCLMPHWLIQGDHEGKWHLQMQIRFANAHAPYVIAEHMVQSLAMSTQPVSNL